MYSLCVNVVFVCKCIVCVSMYSLCVNVLFVCQCIVCASMYCLCVNVLFVCQCIVCVSMYCLCINVLFVCQCIVCVSMYCLCVNVLFVCQCIVCVSMYCLGVNVYCHRVTTQLHLTNISYIIFPENWQMKVVRLSALHTGRLYHKEIFLVLISIRDWVDPSTLGMRCDRKNYVNKKFRWHHWESNPRPSEL